MSWVLGEPQMREKTRQDNVISQPTEIPRNSNRKTTGTYLAVQRLGLSASNSGAQVWSLVRALRSHMLPGVATKTENRNNNNKTDFKKPGKQQFVSLLQMLGFLCSGGWKWKSLSGVHFLEPHGILQARILEWVAVPSSRGSSQPRDQTEVSYTAGRFFTSWAIREVQEC